MAFVFVVFAIISIVGAIFSYNHNRDKEFAFSIAITTGVCIYSILLVLSWLSLAAFTHFSAMLLL